MMDNKIMLNKQQNETVKKAILERWEKVLKQFATLAKKADWTERETAKFKALCEERNILFEIINML